MLIKQINKTTIDVFLNTGWETWGRFKISKKDKQHTKCFQISGTHKFNKKELSILEEAINE